VKAEFALVCFCDYAPYGDKLLHTNFFTPRLAQFNSWAKNISFLGGGYAQNAMAEGIYGALELLQVPHTQCVCV
jgi:acetoin utilization deacetylase AcuC-like enzyme